MKIHTMHILQHTNRKQNYYRRQNFCSKMFCLLMLLLAFVPTFAMTEMEATESSSIPTSENIVSNDSIASSDSTLSAASFTRAGEETATQKYYSKDLYATQYAGGTGTKDDPYQISNDLELARLAYEVNNGTSTAGKYYKLTNNIILNQGLWMPIGTTTNKSGKDYGFQGKFDGDGHSISQMHVVWTNESGLQARWGLFSKINGNGNNESGYASVSDLIIEDAIVEMEKGFTPKGSTVIKLGVLAGEMNANSEISNIIIRNSKVTDNEETYTTTCPYRVGGIVGYLDNASYRIYNIDAETEVDMLVKANCKTMVRIAAGFGNVSGFGINNSYSIAPTNIFVHGKGVTTNTSNSNCNVGGVMAFYGKNYDTNSYLPEANRNTLYYTTENEATGTQPYNIGTEKVYADFIEKFVGIVNQFIKDKNLDRKTWSYSSTSQKPSFITTSIKVSRGTTDILTVELKDGTISKDTFDWYVSSDNQTFKKKNEVASDSFTLPRQNDVQYVYAVSKDGSIRTATAVVKPIRVSATLKSEKDATTNTPIYTVDATNDTGISNDALGLTFTYQWYKGTEALAGENSATFIRPKDAAISDIFHCQVTAKSDTLTLLVDTLYITTVVYLDPAKGDDTNDGYTKEKAVKTWKQAYSQLNEKGSWDENVIVLIGTSSKDVTYDPTKGGFNITSNYRGTSVVMSASDWDGTKNSPFCRNTTITGKWEGIEHNGKIEITGGDTGLPLWGDTRFENITFAKNGGEDYKNIYCQYHNLEMGDSIKVEGFDVNAPKYGTLDGAVTNALQIFGGFNNDGRFYPLNTTANMEKFKAAMPHGKEGFCINIKSGFYSCICVGGRQSAVKGANLNGLMGTPDMPIKCSINIDIDRKWNDDNNEARNVKSADDHKDLGMKSNDYDIGIILAGNHEGAMIGDVDITVKSGTVARIVNGSLGNERNITFDNGNKRFPYNTYMGRANITLDPSKSEYATEGETAEVTNNRVIVTELYGGSTGRGQENKNKVDNPFYGYSTITINGGSFEIRPKDNGQKDNILCGIFGAGAGGMNGIGDDTNPTPDTHIPYWNTDKKTMMLFGPYTEAKSNLVDYTCYNASSNDSTVVDPMKTNTKIIINGGVFGDKDKSEAIDGIYAGGSGYMSQSLWRTEGKPSKDGGNIYGEKGSTVASLTINGGTFYCKNGIFAAGRGTDYYYHKKSYDGEASDYKALGKTYGNVELNISGGTFHCPIFGGGYGVADSKLNAQDSTIYTLSDMARLYGQSFVTITGGTFYDNIYGGGDMAVVEYHGDGMATNLTIGDKADIRGSIFAGGNGRKKRIDKDENGNVIADKDVKINNDTRNPELVGKVIGSTSVFFQGSTAQAPSVYGDVYGGGNLAQVNGDTYVNIYAGNLAGQVFGGGKGRIKDDKGNNLDPSLYTYADITGSTDAQGNSDGKGNTHVTLAQDFGGQEEDENKKKADKFSINVIWNKLWDATNERFCGWDETVKETLTDEDEKLKFLANKSLFYDQGKYVNPHNIYGGGNLACQVTGSTTVKVEKGMTPFALLKTDEWRASYTDNKNPHFSVFGGGYGEHTMVGSTDVTVDVEGDYGQYDAEVDDNDQQLAKPYRMSKKNKKTTSNGIDAQSTNKEMPVFDNSKGIPNFTILAVIGGGYAGQVSGNTKVEVDGQTFLHRVYGGGFGDPTSTTDNTTGQVGGNTEVYVRGAKTYGDIFGGGAGVRPLTPTSDPFTNVARVLGNTAVEVSDDAAVYGKVYGGGDVANVGPADADYTNPSNYSKDLPASATQLDQNTGQIANVEEPYTHSNHRTFVNIIGGNVYGEVFGGGKGLPKDSVNNYREVGRINGNTLVHIANSLNHSIASEAQLDQDGNNIPYVWNRIYGGCAYGTVNGNTLVHVEGGMLGLNIFGGGYGDVKIIDDKTGQEEGGSTDKSTLEQVLGKKDTDNEGTYADILGNTKVQIDGGTWLWNRKADINGNITTWLNANSNSERICKNLDEFKLIAASIKNAVTIDDVTYPQAKAAINRLLNDKETQEFFTLDKNTINSGSFTKNHNIFGGGNRACFVGTYTDANGQALRSDGKPADGTGTATVEINHSPATDLLDDQGHTLSLFDCTSLQGFCWYIGSKNESHPQFSVFGAGYGANTKVGNTKVLIQPGAIIEKNGTNINIDGRPYRYINQEADRLKYTAFQKGIYTDFQKVSPDDKKRYYGSPDGTDKDPNTFRRYHMSRMAWTFGIPSFTFVEVHGGGFSGYVMGDTYVETNNQLGCQNVFGAGLGALPYGTLSESDANGNDYDFGTVYGNSTVFVKSGNISENVYGGGAGVESVRVNGKEVVDITAKAGTIVDFPKMALVKGKTRVHVYGEYIETAPLRYDRTIIIGSVYGGGDVANVGTTKAIATKFEQGAFKNLDTFTSYVNVRGGAILSPIFAGGKGRNTSVCHDYKQLGGIYGNTCVVTDRPVATYPYCLTATGSSSTVSGAQFSSESINPAEEKYLEHPADDVNPDLTTNILNRVYGGGENGTIFGNTLVAIHGGQLGYNIYGGGWGNSSNVMVNNVEEPQFTYADVTGNTHLNISGGEMRLTSYWLSDTRFWEPSTIINGKTYSPQYNPTTQKFKINHNIYGGGNVACMVGEKDADGNLVAGSGNTYLYMSRGLLYNTTQVLSGESQSDFFSTDEWKEVYNKVGSPHFCVFGGGYGEHTVILGDTHLNIEMSERGSIHDEGFNIQEGESYKHFVSGYSVMDFVGGGYSGKVEGDAHISGQGGGFCRRVFGGGFYNSVKNTHVDIKAIDCDDVFGGGLMGDVLENTNITIGNDNNDANTTFTNADIYIHGDVYGGNDVSGYVNVGLDNRGYFADNGGDGTHISIIGGHIYGNVYGAGNGDYLYALDRKGNTQVTVNEDYPLNPDDKDTETLPLVYTVPMRATMPSYKAASDATKIVNINSWRPLTNKATIQIKGSSDSKTLIDGAVYGGGNSATIMKVQSNKAKANVMDGYVKLDIGSHVKIGQVFMGSNGDALFKASQDNDFMNRFQKLNADIYDSNKELDLSDTIDWINDPSNVGISTLYLSTKPEDRSTVYPHLIDLYFQPVETDIQGILTWNGSETGDNGLEDCEIGSFCCGGNRGNMNVYPKTEADYPVDGSTKKIGNVVDYTFPKGLTITDKIVGGCYNANYNYQGKASHEGGYLLGLAHSDYPFIQLNINNDFKPKEVDGAYQGGNVYGGCYRAGTVRGDITINLKSDMLKGKSKVMLEKSNTLLANNPEYAALNVYGAGYGLDSYVYGDSHIAMAKDVACKEPKVIDDDNQNGNFSESGTSANFIYGGGQQGNLIGVTNVEIFNGHVFKSVTGGSYSGYVWGSTQVKVGYPNYYKVNTLQSGKYLLKRVDEDNKDIDQGVKVAQPTIKQSINLIAGEYIPRAIYKDITAKYDSISGKNIPITDANKATYFTQMDEQRPSISWDDINIKIGDAIYGGGYSIANGSSVMANNTTVLKYTAEHNLDDVFNTNTAYKAELKSLPGSTTAGFGGNTVILVADRRKSVNPNDKVEDRDHITISRQEMKVANVADGQDLLGYYYMDTNKQYHYIKESGKYYKGGTVEQGTKPTDMIGNDVYEYDNEGGIFGDGHLSYAQGFRSADLSGYGFASATVKSPKILNTFQRLDILHLTDNCFSLLGARDYATNAMDMTPYSISRVGEIQMIHNEVETQEDGTLNDGSKPRARNYMGLANNILYVGALSSNVEFTDKWHDDTGKEGNYQGFTTYKDVKQKYIDDYFKGGQADGTTFEKRNNGTAKNMIGIASGYALKIQNVQEIVNANNDIEEKFFYGPIYGVIEMNLIDVREDEGGGYVYADNTHKRKGDDTHAVDFLEATGNFVFPYTKTQNRYIVDDCFPLGYGSLDAGENPDEKIKAHYWYVTGFNYHYNAHITGFTLDTETPLLFNSNNEDGIVSLSGLKPKQEIGIVSWKMHSAHQKLDDQSDYSCDLEQRNYDDTAMDAKNEKKIAGNYKLYVGAANTTSFQMPDKNKEDTGFGALLSMKTDAKDTDCEILKTTLPNTLTEGDARIVFQLSDQVNNSTTEYYQKHLAQPCMATLVLNAPAHDEKGEQVRSNVALSKLYTRTGDGTTNSPYQYTKIEKGNLQAGTTYYYRAGETDFYQELTSADKFLTYDESNKQYTEVSNITNVELGNANKIYYCNMPRYYTYTIDLTIEYVQGPDIDGHITIANCALPGEMIRLKKDKVNIQADQSFSVNGYYWRIGKRHKNAETQEWEFDDNTTWSKENKNNQDASGKRLGYDTFNVSDAAGTGLFKDCFYDKTEDYLDVPVYYYMNDYGVQLGVTMNIQGHTDIIPVKMREADSLLVHNYQRMAPHKSGVDLHIPEAIARAKAAQEQQADTSQQGDATTKDSFAEPRIYLSDQSDLTAFLDFIKKDERHGANAQFVVLNDLNIPSTYQGSDAIFAGVMHGNGHVIRGLGKGKALIGENQGQIYNLGTESGSIATKGSTNGGAYHCCFEYAPYETSGTNKDSGFGAIVYRMDGSKDTHYTKDDFRYGKVTYDLNEYYLRARYSHDPNNKDDRAALKYVYDYYANGDYQYSRRTDAITGSVSGYTYLRTGKDSDLPNYGQAETRHDQNHTIDKARAQNYKPATPAVPATETSAEIPAKPESREGDYLAIFDEKGYGTEVMNDFNYWGQLLQDTPEDYPHELASQQVNYMTNRVYRTAAYYGDTKLDAFHYNAYSKDNITNDTYVHSPSLTAIDFTCTNDMAKGIGYQTGDNTAGKGIFYPEVNDNATAFHSFIVKDGVTQNLLVYTAANDESNSIEAYDAVNQALAYNETTQEYGIKGHHIVGTSGSNSTSTAFSTDLLHLVERTANDENSEGETCTNNDFCVPIPFTVNQHAWYVRKPLNYANDTEGSWEGICLPYTATQVKASLNGEITHFYGTPSEEEEADPKLNTHTLHHEYWLRMLESVAEDGKSAVFERPIASTSDSSTGETSSSTSTTSSAFDYTYDNRFFIQAYGNSQYNQVDNSYYATSHIYKDYLPLTANVPYIVRFPGNRYYEFDLTSEFYNNILNRSEAVQTVSFHVYGTQMQGSMKKQAIVIPMTQSLAMTADGYAHRGTFAATAVGEGTVYGIDASGKAFNDASSIAQVMPFRTYMAPASNAAKSTQTVAPSEIKITEQKGAGDIRPELGVEDKDETSNDYLTVRAIGEHRVRIESSRAVNLKVYNASGQLVRILDVQPGTATYSGFSPNLYIFGEAKVKVMVK